MPEEARSCPLGAGAEVGRRSRHRPPVCVLEVHAQTRRLQQADGLRASLLTANHETPTSREPVHETREMICQPEDSGFASFASFAVTVLIKPL